MSCIIPGLIDDLGRECLIRMPYQDLPTASSICKTWRDEITGRDFPRFRKAAGTSRPVIIMAQAIIDDLKLASGHDILKHDTNPNPTRLTYQLTISDPDTGTWAQLPMIPGMDNGLPMFCGLVGFGSDIFVIGGCDPVTWRVTNRVYIYSFLSGKWRKGADMPGVRRSFFGCTTSSYDNKTVLVAGGHDEDKNALKSAFLYDVEEDKWTPLPDMERPRDECKAIFHRGVFHVISGYPTATQGSFERSAEVFNLDAWQWGPVIEDYLPEEDGTGLTCVAFPDGKAYACVGPRSGDLAVRVEDRWHVVGKLPGDVATSHWMCGYDEGKLLVIGAAKVGEEHSGYMLDLNGNKWSKIDVPKEFSGYVQCGCVLEL